MQTLHVLLKNVENFIMITQDNKLSKLIMMFLLKNAT